MIRIIGLIIAAIILWTTILSPFLNCYGEEQDLIDAQYKYNGQKITHTEARERIDAYNTQKTEKNLKEYKAYKDNQKIIEIASANAEAQGY